MTEMWGRMRKAGAGKGKTGTSGGGVREANPPDKPEPLCEAKGSSEVRVPCARKSRYGS